MFTPVGRSASGLATTRIASTAPPLTDLRATHCVSPGNTLRVRKAEKENGAAILQ